MKISCAIIVSLLASQCDAFSAPKPATFARQQSSALNFVPKEVETTASSDFSLSAASLSPMDVKKDSELATTWERFSNWITSTENRLYIGWFGTIMFPTLLAATTCFITAFIAAPPVCII
jgi:hypothetical protein